MKIISNKIAQVIQKLTKDSLVVMARFQDVGVGHHHFLRQDSISEPGSNPSSVYQNLKEKLALKKIKSTIKDTVTAI